MSLVSLVLLSLFGASANALQFAPAGPIGQPAHPPVTAVAVSASTPQVVYAATDWKLFRSFDGGDTWVTLAPPAASIERLAVDPVDSAIVYAVGRLKAYRSDDSGATWKRIGATLGDLHGTTLRIDPREPSTIYIAPYCSYYDPVNGGGVQKSMDRGETWSLLLNRPANCLHLLSLDPAEPRRLYAASSSGTQYRTDDAGWTWQQVSGELPVFAVVADPTDPSRRYGLGRGSESTGYLHFLVSTNAGASWSRVAAEGLPNGGQSLAIDPVTRRLFSLAQSFGVYVSDDLGLHWRHVDAVTTMPATPVAMAVAGDRIFIATSRGLYRLPMSDPDAPTLIHLGEPAPLRLTIQRVALDPNDPSTLYASAYEGHGILNAYRVFRSTDAGRTWERITAEDDTAWRYMLAVDAVGDLYGADKQRMWRFAKATQTWESWSVPELAGTSIFLANPQRPGWLYTASNYSTDGGRTWTRISIAGNYFWSLAIAPNGSDLVGGNNEGGFASSDGGVTWRRIWTAHFLETKSVAIAPSRPQTVYRLTNPGNGGGQSYLYRSDDGGTTWTALRWPGERESALPIAVDPRDHRSLWIGLAHSTDAGVTWTVEPSNLPVEISSVAYNADGTMLFAITRDFSVWRATVRAPRRRATGH